MRKVSTHKLAKLKIKRVGGIVAKKSPSIATGGLILLPLAALVACASHSPTPPPPVNPNSAPEQQFQIPTRSQREAQEIADRSEVSCGTPSTCSPSIGMLVTTSANAAGTCSAFLLSPRILMTNSHCIPKDLKAAHSACNDRIWSVFPETSTAPKEKAGCSQVLFASDLADRESPDYAFIELDRDVNRPALRVNREGLQDQAWYTIQKVDPISKSEPVGLITQASCKAIHDSAMISNSYDDRSPVMILADCPIIHGNSGSPLFDDQGAVHGLIQAFIEQDTISAQIELISQGIDPSTLAKLNIGTNLACLSFPGGISSPPLPPICSDLPKVTPEEARNRMVRNILAGLKKDLQSTLPALSSGLTQDLQWTFALIPDRSLRGHSSKLKITSQFAPFPKCVKNAEAFLKPFRRMLGGYLSQGAMPLSLPIVQAKIHFNEYLVPRYGIESKDQYLASELKFNPDRLSSTGKAVFELYERDILGLRPEPDHQAEIGVCAEAGHEIAEPQP